MNNMKKIFEHVGYYSDLNDILRLYDKMAGDIVDDMLKENGCFS